MNSLLSFNILDVIESFSNAITFPFMFAILGMICQSETCVQRMVAAMNVQQLMLMV